MPEETKPVDEATMILWNRFIDFNKKKGYSGDPRLDHDTKLRQKVFDEFNAENPDTPINQNIVMDAQAEMLDLKKQILIGLKSGKVHLADGVNENNFMSSISKVDGVFGQLTSQWKFPTRAYHNQQTGETKVLGLAPHHDIIQEIKNMPVQ